jgi:hypothetical protein
VGSFCISIVSRCVSFLRNNNPYITMKISVALLAAFAVSGASAYNMPSRQSLRAVGKKSVGAPVTSSRKQSSASIKMEGKAPIEVLFFSSRSTISFSSFEILH